MTETEMLKFIFPIVYNLLLRKFNSSTFTDITDTLVSTLLYLVIFILYCFIFRASQVAQW